GFSFDAVGSKVKDAVSLSNFGESPLPSGVGMNDLKATLSDNTSGVIMLRYTYDAVKLYGGLEYILFRNPSDDYPEGFTTLGNYNVLPGYVNSTAYATTRFCVFSGQAPSTPLATISTWRAHSITITR